MYPIRVIDDWDLKPAGDLSGMRDKWIATEPSGTRHFFKEPYKGSGEHWMEKAAAEIGHKLGYDVIKVDLAQRDGRFGALIEMWEPARTQTARQILEDAVEGYDSQADYTYQQVRDVMEPLGLLPDLHDMLVFDALIDNEDRHDQNWEVRTDGRLMPFFDNSTCRIALLTVPKQRRLAGNKKRRDSEYGNARAALRWKRTVRSYVMTPLRLLREIRLTHGNDLEPALQRVVSSSLDDLRSAYDDIPFPAIDESCRQLAKEALADRFLSIKGLTE